MKNILILGPNNLYSFSRQVGHLMRSRIIINGEKIKLTDLDFGDDKLRNSEGYSYEELSELPFDDAVKIFKAVIRKILEIENLDKDRKNILQNILEDKKIDENEYDFNVFNNAVLNLPKEIPIQIVESNRRDPENIDEFYKNEIPELKQLESRSYIAVDAHGTREIVGGISITNKEESKDKVIHPSKILSDITNDNPEKPIVLDVYCCYAGSGVVGENNTEAEPSFGGYSELPKNTAAILNCDDGDILMSLEKYLLNDLQIARKEHDLNDPFSIFLYKIFQSPNTCKLIYKDEAGKEHIYENEFLPGEISKESIGGKMQNFTDWCKSKNIGDLQKLNKLSEKFSGRLTNDYLKDFGNMAAALTSYRGDIQTAQKYQDADFSFIRVPLPQDATEEKKDEAIKTSNSLSLADHLDNLLRCIRGTGFAEGMTKEQRTEKAEYYREAAIYNIKQGIIPNFVDSHGSPLLLSAVFCQDPEIVNLLLDEGADPMKINKKITEKTKEGKILKSSETKGARIFNVAIFFGNIEIIKAIVENDKFNIQRNDGESSEQALMRIIEESNRKKDNRRKNNESNIPSNITIEQIYEIIDAFKNAHPIDISDAKATSLSTTQHKQI